MSSEQDQGKRDSSGAVLDPTMSLVGRLEDLSLGEILQIVSLSKRSGLLRLEAPVGKASLYIRSGKVIYTGTSDEKDGVLSLLVENGVMDPGELEPFRKRLESAPPGKVRDVLEEGTRISHEKFQDILKKRVEELTYSLFVWEEGTFSFQLIEDENSHPMLSKVAPFFLDEGIGAQFLVMEGARRRDEMMRDAPPEAVPDKSAEMGPDEVLGENWQDEFEEHLSGSANSVEPDSPAEDLSEELGEFVVPEVLPRLPESVAPQVVAVGIQPSLVVELTGGFVHAGVEMILHENGADALTRIQKLRQKGSNPYVLVDLESVGITDGRVFGGLEVISTMWDFGFSLPVGLVVRRDFPGELHEKLNGITGLSVFRLSEPPEKTSVQSMVESVVTSIRKVTGSEGVSKEEPEGGERPIPSQPSGPPVPEPVPRPASEAGMPGAEAAQGARGEEYYDIEREFSEELGDIDLSFEGMEEGGALPQEASLDPHMARLSSYVNELNRQDISGEITLLALRFASAFANRAILFLVRKDDVKGLGQFGVDLGRDIDADSVVRSLNLPMDDESLFLKVARRQQSYKGPPTGSSTEEALFQALGGGVPGEIFAGPIVSMGKVAVLLYGDDYPQCQGLEPTHTLDIFLSHVGLALDRAFLEMKLKSQKP